MSYNLNKMFHIPPFISTTWDQIATLHLTQKEQKPILVVTLKSGVDIEIPNLNSKEIEEIFQSHAEFLLGEKNEAAPTPKENFVSFKMPLNMGDSLTSLGDLMQHNSEQLLAPDLPKELLTHISTFIQAVGFDQSLFPKPEPHCHCPHCQIARIIHEIPEEKEDVPEEKVTVDDLHFKEWEIKQEGEKLYRVTNPLNHEEHYQVFLGEPIGCTCGKNQCEHIRAVLYT